MLLCLFGIIAIACGAGFGYLIVQPFATALKVKRGMRPTRFATSDFLALMVLLAVPLVFLSAARKWQDTDLLLAFGSMLVAVFTYAWWRGVTMLSGLEILDSTRRFVFLALLLPVVLVGSTIAAPTVGFMVLVSVARPAPLAQLFGLLAVPGLAAVAYLLRCRRRSDFAPF